MKMYKILRNMMLQLVSFCYLIQKCFPFLGFPTIAQSFLYKKDSPFFGFLTIAQSFLYHCAIKIGFFFYQKESPFIGFPTIAQPWRIFLLRGFPSDEILLVLRNLISTNQRAGERYCVRYCVTSSKRRV